MDQFTPTVYYYYQHTFITFSGGLTTDKDRSTMLKSLHLTRMDPFH
jgi:hypothetical protein